MKAQLKRIATMLLVVAMSLTQVPQIPLGNTADTSAQAAAGGGTLSYVARYSSNAVLGKLDNHHSTAMMSHIKMNGQEVFCTAIGRGALSGNYKGITVNYGSYLKLMKGAAYYRKVSKGSSKGSYEATQILIWRIKQMQENKTAATAANVMNGDVKDCFNHFASGEFDKAKAVMQRAEKNEFSKAKLEDYSSGNSTQSVVWLDAREEFCSVKLTKKGENTGTKADCSGAVFTVYKGNRAVTSFATDADGKGKSEQVLDTYTTYKVKETKAPKGCVKSDKEYTVKTGGADSVTPVGNNGVITNKEKELQFDILKIGVYVSNQKTKGKKGKVIITKVKKNKKLEGVKFAVQEWSASKHAWNTLETKKTNSKGKVKSSKLKYTRDNQGKFRMKEISSVEGFKVTSNSKVEGYCKDKALTSIAQKMINKDDLTGQVRFHKNLILPNGTVTSQDKLQSLLAGNEFSVFDAAGQLVETVATDGKGDGAIKDLARGKYTLRETKNNPGTMLNGKTYSFEIKEGSTDVVVGNEYVDNPVWYGDVYVHKVDKRDDTTPVPNVVFAVEEKVDNQWREVQTITTDKNGDAKSGLLCYTKENNGNYRVREKECKNPSFKFVDQSQEFTINSVDQHFSYTMADPRTSGSIEIKKVAVDIYGNEVKTGFQGVTYTLYKSWNVVGDVLDLKDAVPNGTISLDENGVGKADDIDVGTYLMVESKITDPFVSDFYQTPAHSMVITIKDNVNTLVAPDKGISFDKGANWVKVRDANGNEVPTNIKDYKIFKSNALVNLNKTMKIDITKVDVKKYVLEGAEFDLEQWSAKENKYVKFVTAVSNESGKLCQTGTGKIPVLNYTSDNAGRYRLVETKAPKGCEKPSYYKEFSFSSPEVKKEGVTYSYTGGYKGQWSAETNYVIGDVVTCDDILYQCVEEKSTGVKPSDSCGYKGDDKGSKWEVLNDFTGKNGEADIRGVFSTDKGKMQKGGFAARFRSEIFRFTSGLYKLKGVRALQGDDAKENSKKLYDVNGNVIDPGTADASTVQSAEVLSLIRELFQRVEFNMDAPATETYNAMFVYTDTVVNKAATPSVTLHKEDKNTRERISGAEFTIFDADDKEIGKMQEKDDKGTYYYEFKDLALTDGETKKIKIVETGIPKPYVWYADATKDYHETIKLSDENLTPEVTVKETPYIAPVKLKKIGDPARDTDFLDRKEVFCRETTENLFLT